MLIIWLVVDDYKFLDKTLLLIDINQDYKKKILLKFLLKYLVSRAVLFN